MSVTRYNKNIGFTKTTAWGTGTDPSTNDLVTATEFTPPAGERQFYTNELEASSGGIATCLEELNFLEQGFSFTIKCRYDDYVYLRALASLWGKYGFDADTPEAGVNKHSFEWNPLIDSTTSLIHTFQYDEGTEIKSVPSCVVNDGTFSYDNGMMLALNLIGDILDISGTPAPISVTKFSPCGGDLLKMSGLTLLMNDQSGSALSSGDEVKINNISITQNHSYEVPAQESGTNYVGQPYQGDTASIFEITIELRAKDATNAAWFTKYQNGTIQKATLTWVGDTITGTATPYTYYVVLPALRFSTPVAYAFESPTPVTATLSVMKATANPAGMTNVVPYGYMYCTLPTLTGYPTI